MPKIPTYKARGQITTQAPSIQTGLQISPTATAAAKLIKPLTQVAEYYERERMIAEKTDAEKQYLELSTELDEIENNIATGENYAEKTISRVCCPHNVNGNCPCGRFRSDRNCSKRCSQGGNDR